MLNGKDILITGGTGSFGKKFVEIVLKKYPNINRLIIYSRDELKQFEMSQLFPESKYSCIRYFIGDIRDGARLKVACENVDVIVHAAALKQVPIAEYNPMECIKTNVFGAENVINAALSNNVKNVIALSTDKAAAPINLYGATKLCSDKLFVAANNIRGKRDVKFSVVRYGNVFASRGSVIPLFIKQKNTGIITITDDKMTRFSLSLEESVNFVLKALATHWGGEIYVPKIPSYKIIDVAKAIDPNCEIKITGIRPGEKIHEEMITENDAPSTIELEDSYIILPSTPNWDSEKFIETKGGKRLESGFKYNSGKNCDWLSVDQLKFLINQYQEDQQKIHP